MQKKQYSDFVIKNKLAEGGEGIIYSCYDKVDKTFKILKVMKGSSNMQEETLLELSNMLRA